MRLTLLWLCWLACLLGLPLTQAATTDATEAHTPAGKAPVVVLTIDGAIEPAAADHFARGLAAAVEQGAQLLVLQLDTPGGLDRSMRAIIKQVLASPIPVASYVAPSGARAASAGTYMLYASHVAAMAPATNLGAATPVAMGGAPGLPAAPEPQKPAQPLRPGAPAASGSASSPVDGAQPATKPAPPAADPMSAKRLSDSSAYIRSLAQLRGRNAAWAEQAVRDSVSLSAQEALEQRVIDMIALDLPDLLRQLDGRTLSVAGGSVQLQTADAPVVMFEAGWRNELLSVIANPSLALILMMLGVYGLIFEFSNPGYLVPGVVGAISLLLGLFALQTLPLNYAGLALLALGIGFLVAEAFVPSFGALGLGGMVAFAIGAVMLVDRDVPGVSAISYALIAVLTVLSAAFVLLVVGMAAKARRRPVVSGAPTLLGQPAQLVEFDAARGEGWALLAGVTWRVRAAADAAAAEDGAGWQPGAWVSVRAVRGNTLDVALLPPQAVSPRPVAADPAVVARATQS